MNPTPLAYYAANLDTDALTPVDALLLDRLRGVLPAQTALDTTAAGPLANVVAALLDLSPTNAAQLTVRVGASNLEPDAETVIANITPETLLLVGPVGTLAESAPLRAFAIAADAADRTLTPLHMLHPTAHGSTLAAVTTATGHAAATLTALAASLATDYDFVGMAYENNRLQFALQDPQQPSSLQFSQSLDGLRGLYHRVFTLETRLALRNLRWRILGKKEGS